MLARLPADDRAAYIALCSAPAHADKGRALAIWICNAYPAEPDSGSSDALSAAVYRVASRINHACLPNAAQAWNRELRRITFQAVRPIAPGDEITASYLGGAGASLTRDERQAELRNLGFECACALCARAESDARAEISDARRARIALLRAQLEAERLAGKGSARTYGQCCGMLDELLRLLREEGIADAWAHGD
eukprot:5515207-Prymnesium_polylepis.2